MTGDTHFLTRTLGRVLAGTVLATALLATPAAAQRNGNEANGRNYQPNPGQVNGAEATTGVAPTPGQQSREAGAVDDVYKQLLGHDRPGSAANPTPAPSAAVGAAPPR